MFYPFNNRSHNPDRRLCLGTFGLLVWIIAKGPSRNAYCFRPRPNPCHFAQTMKRIKVQDDWRLRRSRASHRELLPWRQNRRTDWTNNYNKLHKKFRSSIMPKSERENEWSKTTLVSLRSETRQSIGLCDGNCLKLLVQIFGIVSVHPDDTVVAIMDNTGNRPRRGGIIARSLHEQRYKPADFRGHFYRKRLVRFKIDQSALFSETARSRWFIRLCVFVLSLQISIKMQNLDEVPIHTSCQNWCSKKC